MEVYNKIKDKNFPSLINILKEKNKERYENLVTKYKLDGLVDHNVLFKIPPKITLNNSYEMPTIGLGTSFVPNIGDVVYEGIKTGIRLIDTAERYDNEEEIGKAINRAIKEGIVKREDLFVITKLWIQSKHDPYTALKGSLKRLNLTYVDLYIDHWPFCFYTDRNGIKRKVSTHVLWKNMESLVYKKMARSIGVSNYNVQLLMDLLSYAEIKPAVIECEFHPYFLQTGLRNFVEKFGIKVIGFNSLAKGPYVKCSKNYKNLNLLDEPIIKKIAEKHAKTPGQVALNFALLNNVNVIASTSNPNRISENLGALSFKLDDEDLNEISKLNVNNRFCLPLERTFSDGTDLFA